MMPLPFRMDNRQPKRVAPQMVAYFQAQVEPCAITLVEDGRHRRRSRKMKWIRKPLSQKQMQTRRWSQLMVQQLPWPQRLHRKRISSVDSMTTPGSLEKPNLNRYQLPHHLLRSNLLQPLLRHRHRHRYRLLLLEQLLSYRFYLHHSNLLPHPNLHHNHLPSNRLHRSLQWRLLRCLTNWRKHNRINLLNSSML